MRALLFISTITLSSSLLFAADPAFPGAEGFGAAATGGKGGATVHVTNLNDSGDGSFRDAVSEAGRIVVFDVSGTIKIESQIACSSDLTIDGSTSPGDGITVYGNGISFSKQHNIICRYMRFRSSIKSSRGSKTFNITEGSNMIFDHLSVSWGRWDNGGITGKSHDITVQNCIFSEAIGPQNFGMLIDVAENVTLCRNLFADNQSRNPKGEGQLQYVNNVVYNWGSNGYVGSHSTGGLWRQDIIANYFIKGPSSSDRFLSEFAYHEDTKHGDEVFQAENLADLNCNGVLDGRAVADDDLHGSVSFAKAPHHAPAVAVTKMSAAEAYEKVIGDAGDSTHRDAVDQKIIDQVKSLGKSGAIIPAEPEAKESHG